MGGQVDASNHDPGATLNLLPITVVELWECDGVSGAEHEDILALLRKGRGL